MKNLKTKLSYTFYTFLCVVFLSSCDCKKTQKKEVVTEVKEVSKIDTLKTKKEDEGLGLGITTSGKVGVEISEGIILDTDGSMGIGIGF